MKYGLQMYSVRDLTEHDLRGALQQVAEMATLLWSSPALWATLPRM